MYEHLIKNFFSSRICSIYRNRSSIAKYNTPSLFSGCVASYYVYNSF